MTQSEKGRNPDHATAPMDLEGIILSKISHSQNDKYLMIPLTGGPKSSQVHRHGGWNAGCQRLGGTGMEETLFNKHRVSALKDEKSSADGGTIML